MPVDVVHVRPARPKDADALFCAYEEAWRGAYRGIIPHLSLERMIARRNLRWWQKAVSKRSALLVLDFDGLAAGYVTFGPGRTGQRLYGGEIYELYLHPTYQGLGLGPKLFDGARERLRTSHIKGLLVWAIADNETACAFYLGRGGKPIAEAHEHFGDTVLRKTAFAWS